MAGRPSDYSEEAAERILALMEEGKSMREICRMESSPSRASVRRWRAAHPEFDAECARVSLDATDDEFDDLRDIERKVLEGEIPSDVARVVISSRQWRLDKLNRNKYGQLAKSELSGPNGSPISTAGTLKIEFVEPDAGDGED